jgi:hypothetical protein
MTEQSLSTAPQTSATTTRGNRQDNAGLSLLTPFTLIVYSEVHLVASEIAPGGLALTLCNHSATANSKKNGSLSERVEDTS